MYPTLISEIPLSRRYFRLDQIITENNSNNNNNNNNDDDNKLDLFLYISFLRQKFLNSEFITISQFKIDFL